MVNVMATSLDWRKSAATNLEQLSTAIAKATTYGVRFHNDMKGLVITENVAHAAQQPQGSEMAEAQRKIKAKYLYNRVHDAESIIDMMSFWRQQMKNAIARRRQCQKTTKHPADHGERHSDVLRLARKRHDETRANFDGHREGCHIWREVS